MIVAIDARRRDRGYAVYVRSGTSDAARDAVEWAREAESRGAGEESFIARLTPGDCFVFAGRVLEFLRVREMTAWVRLAPQKSAVVTRWLGAKMPLSTFVFTRPRASTAATRISIERRA